MSNPVNSTLPDIQTILAQGRTEMQAVDQLIRARLVSDVALVNQVAEHIVQAGGKRLRPLLACTVARALEYQGQRHTQLAAIIEFIHTATLLHDDVVDESSLRRGRQTANALFGNAASVLVGDYLYSRSFQLMVELDDMTIQRVLADTTNAIAEGEVLQLLHVHNPDTDETAYLRVIERKTAVLFAGACRLSGLVAGASEEQQQKLHDFGMHLGYAFQIADDVLDYTSDAATMGKNLGDDLAEGKSTLPLIHALSNSSGAQQQRLRDIIQNGVVDAFAEVLAIIQQHRSAEYALDRAVHYAQLAREAIDFLPDSSWKQMLLAFVARLMILTARHCIFLVWLSKAVHCATEVDELPIRIGRLHLGLKCADGFCRHKFIVRTVHY
jgi:octaprenyl-diphosphate synthase